MRIYFHFTRWVIPRCCRIKSKSGFVWCLRVGFVYNEIGKVGRHVLMQETGKTKPNNWEQIKTFSLIRLKQYVPVDFERDESAYFKLGQWKKNKAFTNFFILCFQ
jgi:hypothetical protein